VARRAQAARERAEAGPRPRAGHESAQPAASWTAWAVPPGRCSSAPCPEAERQRGPRPHGPRGGPPPADGLGSPRGCAGAAAGQTAPPRGCTTPARQRGRFLQRLAGLPGLRWLSGGAWEGHGGGTGGAHPRPDAQRAPRGRAARHALLLRARRRAGAIGAVGTVEPTASGTWRAPRDALRGQGVRQSGGASGCPTQVEPRTPSGWIRVEPTVAGAWADGSRCGEVARASPAGGHHESLTARGQTRSGSGLEGGVEWRRLHIAQGPLPHDVLLPGVRPGRVPALIGHSYSRFV
jgi:hypothetical protein